jgi:membrane protein DedA with SNARE-associated domain
MSDWIIGLVDQTGYVGIVLLMLAENVFPPIPSELIMPMAGFVAARDDLTATGVVLAGATGSLLGALLWYQIGRWIGLDRLKRWAGTHGRWLTISPEEVDQAAAWFDRHCGKAVLIDRLIPAVRTLISVPAGVAGMSLARFLAYSAVGTALWTALLAAGGYLPEDQYHRVSNWLNPVSNVILGLIVLGYLYRVATFRRRSAR